MGSEGGVGRGIGWEVKVEGGGVRVRGLAQDLQQDRIGDKEEPWEHQPVDL